VNDAQNQYCYVLKVELELVSLKKVKNLVVRSFKRNFFVKEVLNRSSKQLLILIAEASLLIIKCILSNFVLEFSLLGNNFVDSILFTTNEKVIIYQEFDLMYGFLIFLKGTPMKVSYQFVYDRNKLSIKSIVPDICNQDILIQRKTVVRSDFRLFLIDISTFDIILTRVKQSASFEEFFLEVYGKHEEDIRSSNNLRYTGIIRYENEFDQDEKNSIRENLLLNNDKLQHLQVLNMGNYYVIRRKMVLKGGMDHGMDFDDHFEINFEPAGLMGFYNVMEDTSIFDDQEEAEGVIMIRVFEEAELNRFNINVNENVTALYAEEMARISREDQRHDEDISREDNIAVAKANINTIIERMGILAQDAVNVANTEIIWDRNQPFEVLKGIFTLIVEGWKQSLVTAFDDRNLRLETYKNIIMRYEIDNNKYFSFFDTFLHNHQVLFNLNNEVGIICASVFWEFGECISKNFKKFQSVRNFNDK
jgi:hypothetical protein